MVGRQTDRQRRKPSKVACVILLDARVWRIGEVDMIAVECVSSVLTSLLREGACFPSLEFFMWNAVCG